MSMKMSLWIMFILYSQIVPIALAEGQNTVSNQHGFTIMHFLSNHIRAIAVVLIPVTTVLAMFACMMAGQGQTSNLRDPPIWDPAMSSSYPFRDWSRDILLWSTLNGNMNSAQKAAAVSLKLRGSAKRLARNIPPQVMINGGLIQGVQLDPMGYLMHVLSEPFARLGEEQNLSAIANIMTFDAIPGERIEDLLIRFDEALDRGQEYGNIHLDVTQCVWILMTSLKLSHSQFQQLLQRFNGRLPQTDLEFQDMRV
jgi:hypothetical protein